jgi:hypothetical protein
MAGRRPDSGGQKYLDMHRRLVSYFDHKNCASPRELADETLSRVARRLEEEGSITGATPAHYCYIVARFVFLEHQRQKVSLPISTGEVPAVAKPERRGPKRAPGGSIAWSSVSAAWTRNNAN